MSYDPKVLRRVAATIEGQQMLIALEMQAMLDGRSPIQDTLSASERLAYLVLESARHHLTLAGHGLVAGSQYLDISDSDAAHILTAMAAVTE